MMKHTFLKTCLLYFLVINITKRPSYIRVYIPHTTVLGHVCGIMNGVYNLQSVVVKQGWVLKIVISICNKVRERKWGPFYVSIIMIYPVYLCTHKNIHLLVVVLNKHTTFNPRREREFHERPNWMENNSMSNE